jgi:hypothetical protein
MGLLNDKERVFDSILTDEGRRQLGSGRFKPAFYSFSDAGAVYSPLDTYATGSVPNSSIRTLLAFEAFPLPQDQVAYEADDSGGLRAFGNNNYFDTELGQVRVISGQLVAGWQNGTPQVLSSSAQFASAAESVVSGTTDNFRRLMLLKSPDLLYTNRDQFIVDRSSVEFRINKTNTFLAGDMSANTIEASENMFSDRKLSHLDNFLYFPPINKKTVDNSTNIEIGDYSSAVNGNREIRTLEQLRAEFDNVVIQNGSVQERSISQRETIKFSETTITNRIMGQMFEIGNGKITKLDVVDFGVFTLPANAPLLFPETTPSPLNPDNVTATTRVHVYFVGKVMRDATGNDKFINMFSLVFQ